MQAVGPDGHIVFRTRVLGNFAIGQVRHKLVASIEIEDDGPGVPAEIAESIFYPLVTGRPDGTGLGLPISQDLVSQAWRPDRIPVAPGQDGIHGAAADPR